MTVNKWTLGLVSVGLVSLGSVAQAEEKLSAVQTALSSTTLSGYVDTSAQWNVGSGSSGAPGYAYGGPSKADGFNLNVVNLTLEKALDEGQWSAGYRVDLAFGPDSTALGTGGGVGGDNNIRQAYVALRAPVGNGLDLKIGTWDTIVGYESTDSWKNPNFTRSWGYSIEPTTHTGILAEYVLSDLLTFKAGIANDFGPVINAKPWQRPTAFNPYAGGGVGASESSKTYMGSVTINAPESAGALHGSSLTVGVINGYDAASDDTRQHYYVGGNIATPVEGLGLGLALDYTTSDLDPLGPGFEADVWAAALYASFKASDKLGFHVRAEYFEPNFKAPGGNTRTETGSLTGTVQYDLWENVLTRLEVRWDRNLNGNRVYGFSPATGGPDEKNSVIVAANVVYKF